MSLAAKKMEADLRQQHALAENSMTPEGMYQLSVSKGWNFELPLAGLVKVQGIQAIDTLANCAGALVMELEARHSSFIDQEGGQ